MPHTDSLQIKDLHVSTLEGKKIIRGLTLTIKKGETHAVMGPNGGGKSTLAQALMGHPAYKITQGTIVLNGTDITKLPADERAKRGLFLGFQYPAEVAGVNFAKFLRLANNEVADPKEARISPLLFRNHLKRVASDLGFSEELAKRSLNQDFSGGEKKKAEIVQLAILQPQFAILDEPDSGLDVDALRAISEKLLHLDFSMGLLLITHYQRILEYIQPDFIHVIVSGRIIHSGDGSLASQIEQYGYGQFTP